MATASELAIVPSFRLGAFEVRPPTREVLAPAGREVIEPKVMQVLVAFAAARGEIVTRDALVDACWDGRAVSEDAISRVVQRLRRLSESLGPGGFVIRTVHKVGYRLIEATPASQAQPTPPVPDPALSGPAVTPAQAGAHLAAGAAMDLGYRGAPAATHPPTADRFARRDMLRPLVALAATLAGAGALRSWQGNPGAERVAALISQSEQAHRSGTPQGDAAAAGHLEQAIALQPDNPSAWGRLALARSYLAESAAPTTTAAMVTAAGDAAARALALDPSQVDALGALAMLPPYYGDWLAADRRMATVLARHPNHLPTRDARDFLLSAVGRGREGSLDRVKMAAEDRLHTNYQFKLIYAHWLLGQVDAATRAADRALLLWPRHPAVWSARFYLLALTGRPERALAHVDNPGSPPPLPRSHTAALRAVSIALASRRPADIDRASAALVAGVTRSPGAAIGAVAFLSGLGEIDRAFAVADAYLLERGPLIASLRWPAGATAATDDRRRKTNMLFLPSSAPLHADPRFAVLMDRIGLAAYWSAAGVTPDHLA